MQHLIDSARKALRDDNFYAALFMALALPDICGKIQYPNERSSETRYANWFKKYVSQKYRHRVGRSTNEEVFLSGSDCYALRCSLLHEGVDVISHQRCRLVLDSFLFLQKSGNHCNYLQVNGHKFLQLSVEIFCEDVYSSVETWLKDVSVYFV